MELEEAIKILKTQLDTKNEKGYYKPMCEEATRVVLNHLTKQEKMIESLIKHICDIIDNDDNASLLPFYNSDDNIEEKVRQYFEKKAEEN